MEVKRYTGSDMKQVMAQIKAEMGPDAIILHTGKTKARKGIVGWFTKPILEVVAARDNIATRDVAFSSNDEVTINSHRLQAMELQLIKLNEAIQHITADEKRGSILGGSPNKKYIDLMLDKGVCMPLAEKVVAEASIRTNRSNNDIDMKQQMILVIKEYLGKPKPLILDERRQNVIILLGPTGVGKTTTLAKLAAYYAIQLEKKVALITADTYRIAAVDQLRTYGDIMGLPLSVVYSPVELEGAIKKYSNADMIMIDTAGRSPKDVDGIKDIKNLIKVAGVTDAFLLVSATFNYASCVKLWETFRDIDDLRLIFTKVDETEAWGTILNMRYLSQKPLSYVTTGQTVPDDIKTADVNVIAHKIIGEIYHE